VQRELRRFALLSSATPSHAITADLASSAIKAAVRIPAAAWSLPVDFRLRMAGGHHQCVVAGFTCTRTPWGEGLTNRVRVSQIELSNGGFSASVCLVKVAMSLIRVTVQHRGLIQCGRPASRIVALNCPPGPARVDNWFGQAIHLVGGEGDAAISGGFRNQN